MRQIKQTLNVSDWLSVCLIVLAFLKWANSGLFYHLFLVFSNKHYYNFYNKYVVKNVHPGAGIQNHDLQNVSLLPVPLDQGSHPKCDSLCAREWQNVYLIERYCEVADCECVLSIILRKKER